MHKKRIRYICCQPANIYFAWQVEVVINNFKKMGIRSRQIDIVTAIKDEIPDMWKKLALAYNDVRFFFYKDTRENDSYIPSIYFNMMKQHIAANPSLDEEALFLHDADIIFTRPLNLQEFLVGDEWYLSNTVGYIGYKYIKSKGIDLYYNKMCEIVGIDPKIPKLLNHASGGAQYIVKNTTFEFWDKVEKDSITMYEYFNRVEPYYTKKHEHDYPIQKWTAGMWSLLWNAWLFEHETVVTDKLAFCWATEDIIRVEERPIFHNSGVVLNTNSDQTLFFKGNYTDKLPYNEVLNIDKKRASYFYWQEIQETAKKSVLI